MASKKSIQLAFHNSSLSGKEAENAEKIGMLLLASDFIGSGKINKADHLERISKANITFLLSRTKSGDYLAINPFSEDPLKVQLTQLPSLSSITEFVSDPSNLDLNKIYRQIKNFETQETEIKGAFSANQIPTLEKLLKAPQSDRTDFETLKPTRNYGEIKEDIDSVNSLVYDQDSLEKEIDERLDIIEKALKEEMDHYEQKYKERDKYWRSEIENKNELLAKRLKEREKQLEKEIKEEEKRVDKKIAQNMEKFRKGVAKNIRKDQKAIDKSIASLEKLVDKNPDRDMVEEIEKELIRLNDFTNIFSEAVGFALRQVDIVKQKELDILEFKEITIENLKKEAEKDKEELRKESDKKEKERDREMKQLKEDRDVVKQRFAKFRDLRKEWKEELKKEIGGQKTALVSQSLIPGSNRKTVELQIPTYIFQYHKENEQVALAVPPVKMPSNMKKPSRGSFYGDHKTVYYELMVDETERIITDWFVRASQTLDLQANIDQLENLLDDPADLRDAFFNNRSLMVEKLRVDKNNFKKANDRLTEVFTSG